MSRINTNINSFQANRALTKNQADLSTRLQRLSTGLRINTGKDDPAGLIASETLRSEINGISTAVDNTNRASNVINTAEGALNETSSLLNQIQSLVLQSANTGALSDEEIKANQLQLDSILTSINRIANTTEFGGPSPARWLARLHHDRRRQRRDRCRRHQQREDPRQRHDHCHRRSHRQRPVGQH